MVGGWIKGAAGRLQDAYRVGIASDLSTGVSITLVLAFIVDRVAGGIGGAVDPVPWAAASPGRRFQMLRVSVCAAHPGGILTRQNSKPSTSSRTHQNEADISQNFGCRARSVAEVVDAARGRALAR